MPPPLPLAAAAGVLLLRGAGAGIWSASRAGDALGVRGEAWEAAPRIASHDPLGVGLDRAGAVEPADVPGNL